MATLAELRARSAATGTARKEKLKKTLKVASLAIAGVITALLLTIWVVGAINSNTQQASTQQAPAAKPAPTAQAAYAPNTSKDCPGELSKLKIVGTVEETFNPNGCYFYSLGEGTVEYSGLFIGTLTVDLKTGKGDTVGNRKVYTVRSAGSSPARWQYILCSGPKQNMRTMDCS